MQKITELDNGLRIVTQNMPGLETISMGIWNAVEEEMKLKQIMVLRIFWNIWHLKAQRQKMLFK